MSGVLECADAAMRLAYILAARRSQDFGTLPIRPPKFLAAWLRLDAGLATAPMTFVTFELQGLMAGIGDRCCRDHILACA